MHEYIDNNGNPIDVYIKINVDLEIVQPNNSLPFGEFGQLNASISYDSETLNFANSSTPQFGDNSFLIELGFDKFGVSNLAPTLAHEKGHIDSVYFDYKSNYEFRKSVSKEEYISGRDHLENQPTGIRAENEETNFRSKVKNSNRFFKKYADLRTY